MLDEVKQQVETTVVPLIKGILDDTQTLLRQEITLARVEVSEDVKRAREAAVALSGGVFAAGLAAVLLAFTIVHGLVALVPTLPLWGAYGIVFLTVGVIAAVLLASAKGKAKAVNMIPEQTIETMRENVQWIQRKV